MSTHVRSSILQCYFVYLVKSQVYELLKKQIQRIYVPCHIVFVFDYMSYHETTSYTRYLVSIHFGRKND